MDHKILSLRFSLADKFVLEIVYREKRVLLAEDWILEDGFFGMAKRWAA